MFDYLKVSRSQAIESAKRLQVDSIWKIANIEVREGITFPETAEIFEGKISGTVDFSTALVVNNLKRAWQFLFQNIDAPIGYSLMSKYNEILGAGEFNNNGKMRDHSSRITGTSYAPLLPTADIVLEGIARLDKIKHPVEKGLMCFAEVAKGQWFNDGNKRTGAMLANHSLVQQGAGLFAPGLEDLKEYFSDLIAFYEGKVDRQSFLYKLYMSSFELIPSGLTPLHITKQLSYKNVSDFIADEDPRSLKNRIARAKNKVDEDLKLRDLTKKPSSHLEGKSLN